MGTGGSLAWVAPSNCKPHPGRFQSSRSYHPLGRMPYTLKMGQFVFSIPRVWATRTSDSVPRGRKGFILYRRLVYAECRLRHTCLCRFISRNKNRARKVKDPAPRNRTCVSLVWEGRRAEKLTKKNIKRDPRTLAWGSLSSSGLEWSRMLLIPRKRVCSSGGTFSIFTKKKGFS